MSGIAQHLHNNGYHVAGSDRTQNEYTQRLKSIGVDVQREDESIANYQLVVKTSAVRDNHPQVVQATLLGIPVVIREQVLGEIFDNFATRIAICGTHGKTTATGLMHHVLHKCGIAHTAFVGGSYQNNNYFGGGDIVVAEACEYNSSFLQLHPTHTLCLNVEHDHPDCFDTLAEVENAFGKFFEQSQVVVLPKNLQKLCTNGVFCDQFCAQNVLLTPRCTTFDLYHEAQFVCKIKMPLVGAHNVQNALAVVSLCHALNLPLMEVCHAFGTFHGVTRRWTELPYKCKLVCDYAHHPTEIQATLRCAKALAKGKVVCIFQPHTYTRTKAFWRQFATCFDGATVVYLPIFAARERPIEGVTSQILAQFACELGIDAHYFCTFDEAKSFVERVVDANDTLLILGAGDVVEMAHLLSNSYLPTLQSVASQPPTVSVTN